jgi:hypothetical protein
LYCQGRDRYQVSRCSSVDLGFSPLVQRIGDLHRGRVIVLEWWKPAIGGFQVGQFSEKSVDLIEGIIEKGMEERVLR